MVSGKRSLTLIAHYSLLHLLTTHLLTTHHFTTHLVSTPYSVLLVLRSIPQTSTLRQRPNFATALRPGGLPGNVQIERAWRAGAGTNRRQRAPEADDAMNTIAPAIHDIAALVALRPARPHAFEFR